MLKTSWDAHEALHTGLQHVHVGGRGSFQDTTALYTASPYMGWGAGGDIIIHDQQEIRCFCFVLKKINLVFLEIYQWLENIQISSSYLLD